MTKKNFIDTMFDGAEAIVGGLEESKKLADPLPPEEEDDEDEKRIINVKSRSKIIWGLDKEVSTYHLFQVGTSAFCGRYFDSHQLVRKTELEDGNFKCCGGCLRILQSKYEHS